MSLGPQGEEELMFGEADELKNPKRPFTVQPGEVVPIKGIRLLQLGPAWDGGSSFCLARVELRSSGPNPLEGVIVTANDCAQIFKPDNKYTVRTYSKPGPSWFGVALEGKLLVKGYTFKRVSDKAKYVLRGSNNVEANLSDWVRISGTRESPDGLMVTVTCAAKEPYSFFRLVLEEPRGVGLSITHWELFGVWSTPEPPAH
jgi:hypothetical protein